MSDSLGARWKAGSAWFAARQKREKWVLVFASLAVVWAVADAVWLTPATKAYKTQRIAAQQKESELAQLAQQRTTLSEAIRVRADAHRKESEATQARLAEVVGQLSEFEKGLVPARQMPTFLRSLLPGAGLEVVSLKTLPPTPLIVRATNKESDAKTPASKEVAGKGGAPAANIYKHGLEITLAGDYEALLAYLNRLERSPQKVLWGHLTLKVEKHPRNELTLVLYTLSLDPLWLTV